MLDVHPPHHAANTWRDFFIHIATIVVGLLIAIGLEQTVEFFHHRHIVREARETIHHEIELNRDAVKEDLANIDLNQTRMKSDLVTLRVLYKNPNLKEKHLSYLFDWSSFNQSAWLSARDSGALTYMPPDEVQRYADIYDGQELVTSQATVVFAREAEVYAPFLMDENGDLSADEIRGVMRDTALTSTRLKILRQLVQQLGEHYSETLRK